MAAPRAADDGSFNWPPTETDLAGIDIVATAAVPSGVPGSSSASAGRARRTRPPTAGAKAFTRVDGLLLLAAGMLLGSAVPSLDTAPPTRLGVRAAAVAPTSGIGPVNASLAPSEEAPDGPSPARPEAASRSNAAASAGAAATVPRPTATPTPQATVPVDPRTQQVVAVVQAYGRAWSRMDARAARAVMPSLDVRALTRDFTSMREQRLTLSGCRVSGTGATATASCNATRRYRPRQGDHSTRVERGRWQFRVQRTAQRWVITDVDQG